MKAITNKSKRLLCSVLSIIITLSCFFCFNTNVFAKDVKIKTIKSIKSMSTDDFIHVLAAADNKKIGTKRIDGTYYNIFTDGNREYRIPRTAFLKKQSKVITVNEEALEKEVQYNLNNNYRFIDENAPTTIIYRSQKDDMGYYSWFFTQLSFNAFKGGDDSVVLTTTIQRSLQFVVTPEGVILRCAQYDKNQLTPTLGLRITKMAEVKNKKTNKAEKSPNTFLAYTMQCVGKDLKQNYSKELNLFYSAAKTAAEISLSGLNAKTAWDLFGLTKDCIIFNKSSNEKNTYISKKLTFQNTNKNKTKTYLICGFEERSPYMLNGKGDYYQATVYLENDSIPKFAVSFAFSE